MSPLLPKGDQIKLLKFFWLKIFSICHRWQTLSCVYLREFSKKFETVLMEYSGAGGKLIHEKNQKQKISWHCPFKCSNLTLLFYTRVLKIKEREVKKFVKETHFSQTFWKEINLQPNTKETFLSGIEIHITTAEEFLLEKLCGIDYLSYTVISRDLNFCYPYRVPLTQFVHIAKKTSGMWAWMFCWVFCATGIFQPCNEKVFEPFPEWNCAASVPIPTFVFMRGIYIFPRLVCLFCCRKIVGPIVGIYRSLTETWMWKL